MPSPDGIVLGFDPGGKNAFGWSVCVARDGQLQPPIGTNVANSAIEALKQVEEYLERVCVTRVFPLLAAGIDAPMFWSEQGNRAVDQWLRDSVRAAGLTGLVMQVNSLQGSVLVQGVLLGEMLFDTWGLEITESHPKVLLHLLEHSRRPLELPMAKRATYGLKDHVRDATLAAISAWAMVHKPCGWQNLYELECKVQKCQPVQPFNTHVAYWMPIPRESAHS